MDKKIALTIAGSDPSGGAGIQQDIKVLTCLKVYSCAVITAITVQNTLGVKKVEPVSPVLLKDQLDVLLADVTPHCIKLGMLATKENVKVVAEILRQVKDVPVVADPVMLSKNNRHLLDENARISYIEELFPVIDVLTPNIIEAEEMTKMDIRDEEAMKEAALKILSLMEKVRLSPYSPVVMIKGGHLSGFEKNQKAIDVVAYKKNITEFVGKRVHNKHTHGTGCTLASAICGYICKGEDFINAISLAKKFISGAIKAGFALGHGIGPVDPMFIIY